jgi:hypothetical protein
MEIDSHALKEPRPWEMRPCGNGNHSNKLNSVRGHPSVSLPPLSSPTLPLFICIPPLTSVPSLGITPKADDFHTRRSDDFLDVDSLKVIDFRSCKGNLTILRRILHLDLAKGDPK